MSWTKKGNLSANADNYVEVYIFLTTIKITPGKSMPISRPALSDIDSSRVCDGNCITAH